MMNGLAEWRGSPPPYMVRPLGVPGDVVRRDLPLRAAELVIKRQHHPGCRRIIGIEASLAPVPSGAGYRRGGTDFVAIAAVIDEGRHHWNESRGCSRQGGPNDDRMVIIQARWLLDRGAAAPATQPIQTMGIA